MVPCQQKPKSLNDVAGHYAEQGICDGIEKVLKNLGSSPKQSIGAKLVLEYADNFEASAVKFEVEELIETTTEQGKKLVTRRYDAVIHGVKHEMKCWREWLSWSDNAVCNQLINDLGNENLEKLANLQWVFKKTDGITEQVLKEKVIAALRSKNGREALERVFETKKDHFARLFGEKDLNNVDELINKIETEEIFNQIFKVYE